MADYSEYKPRTFDDDLRDLATVEEVLKAFQVITLDHGPRDWNDRQGRAYYALQRVKKGIEDLKLRDAQGG